MDVFSTDTLPTNGGKQIFTFVNEDGLYDVILDSRKPEAKGFRKWVTSEVLPSIRKTGSYSIQNLSRKELVLMVIQAEEENERLALENKQQANFVNEYGRYSKHEKRFQRAIRLSSTELMDLGTIHGEFL